MMQGVTFLIGALLVMMTNKKMKACLNECKGFTFFKRLNLFAHLSDEEIAPFVHAAQCKTYPKGQVLYVEGDKADYFYVVCEGWLKLFHTTEEGEELTLAMFDGNSITGQSALFEGKRYASSAQIVEDAQILSIPLSLLEKQLRANSQIALNMLASVIHYQRQHELQFEQYFLYSAPQRIGCFLLGLCPVQDQKDGVKLRLPYDKTLIASTLGMKGPTFSRALNILRDETGLHISGTSVTIDSMERLLTFVDGCYSALHLPKI